MRSRNWLQGAIGLAQHGWSVDAVDSSAAACEMVRLSGVGGIQVFDADLERDEFKIGLSSYDLIVACCFQKPGTARMFPLETGDSLGCPRFPRETRGLSPVSPRFHPATHAFGDESLLRINSSPQRVLEFATSAMICSNYFSLAPARTRATA